MRSENEPDSQPRSFIEEARRRQIIASAVEVLADEGYGRATLARIARHAGISKGVISYHFAGKDELMREVVVQLYTAGAEFMVPRIVAANSATGRLRAYVKSNLEFIHTNRRYISVLVDVVLNLRNRDGSPVFSPSEGDDAMVAPLAEILIEGQSTGEFSEFDPWTLARIIRDSIDGASQRAARDPDFDTAGYTAQMLRLFMNTVLASSTGPAGDPPPKE